MRFKKIKSGFSENRKPPELGKIRLGIKVKKIKEGGVEVEYPRETKHFVCPKEVTDIYGLEPTELDIMFLSDKDEEVFPQNLAWFGKSKGLKCEGDMTEALRLNDQTGEWEKRTCPCEHYKSDENPKGECTENGILRPILHHVSMGGFYSIRTGSYHSSVAINSALEYIRALVGRIAMIPLKLRRVAKETHNDGKKQTHYTLALVLDANVDGLNQLRHDTSRVLETAKLIQIEGPEPTNPHLDDADVVEGEVEAEDLSKMEDAELATVQQRLNELNAKPAPQHATNTAQGKPSTAEAAQPQKQGPAKESSVPPKETKVAQPAQSTQPKGPIPLIPMEEWQSIVFEIDNTPELNALKKEWKKEHNVDNILKLLAIGQRSLMAYIKEGAAKQGVQVSF